VTLHTVNAPHPQALTNQDPANGVGEHIDVPLRRARTPGLTARTNLAPAELNP
jgi:hypothetical protein